MNKDEILAEIKANKDEMDVLRKQLSEKVHANFHKMAKKLFNEYPELTSFGWTQYTPYFNDGEACQFNSHHTDPFINGFDSYSSSHGDVWGYFDNGQDGDEPINIYGEDYKYYNRKRIYGDLPGGGRGEIDNPNYNPRFGEIDEAVKSFLNVFDESDYEDLFGDHVSVIVTADWIETQEIEHD